MLKYQSANNRHASSSPQIDSMFLFNKLATTPIGSHIKTEKDQISEIRNMGKILFDEEFGSEVTFDEKHNNDSQTHTKEGNKSKYKIDLYERGKINGHKKW